MASHLAHGLSALGNQVTVVTMGKKSHYTETGEPGLRVYQFRPLNLYPLEQKDTESLWKRMIWQFVDVYNFHSAKVLRQILEKESPDIIHINKMRGFSGAVWSVSSQLLPGRVIQTCHDYESMSPDGILRGPIGRMAVRKQWPIRGYQLIRARLSRGVSFVAAPSAFTLKRIQDSGLFRSAQSEVIVNTHGWSQIELESIQQRAIRPADEVIRFLFLGRLEPEKGIIELCKAFISAFEQNPLLCLDIAGWGSLDAGLRHDYASCAGIRFLGHLSQQTKMDALNRADMVVVPSLVEEVFGLAVIEAFAFGRPVIASNLGGLPELVRDGETGWTVEAGNISALASLLLQVAKIPPLERAARSNICRKYSFEFSLEKVLARYQQVYRQLIK
jgi:glycosyltransferase involved in cell wall biosynthesis